MCQDIMWLLTSALPPQPIVLLLGSLSLEKELMARRLLVVSNAYCMSLSYSIFLELPQQDLTLPETNMAPENGWLEY